MIDRQRLRNIIGSCDVEDVPDLTDNIAIALCTYFSAHMDRPDPDPESESGWGEWVTTKTNAALSLLASAVLKEVERTTNQPSAAQCRLEEKPCGDIWLHMTAPSGNKASLNLGHKPLDKLSFIDRVMLECATAHACASTAMRVRILLARSGASP